MHRSLVPLLALLLALPATAAAKPNKKVCGDTAAGFAHCHARVVTDAKGDPAVTPAPNGYGPADLRAAYSFPSTTAGSGKVFAIVDAYDAPTAEADLGTYRTTYNSHFNHPGVPITVSTGDSGYGVEFPAASQYVTAVGGTSLARSGSAYSERAWSGAGSGCSAFVAKPSWQKDTGCARRTVAD